MGYMHINNLYKDQRVLLFKECYALEKIHGTSAHVALKGGQLTFFAGGVKHAPFVALFDHEALAAGLGELGQDEVVVYGEAYGGSCQGMSATYGKELRFVAFDVRMGESWLCVPAAHQVVERLGLEFVHYEKGPATVEWLNEQRDRPSTQAKRNGIDGEKMMEGVVVRPLEEMRMNNGERVIAKHKRADFSETRTPREVSPDKLQVLADAEAVALEWVTITRLGHVMDHLQAAKGQLLGIEDTGLVVKAMVEDVVREGEGEIVDSKDARRAIGARAAYLFKEVVMNVKQ